jgi:Flp pilus assembly protein TadB
MSPTGALFIALSAILILGALAAWLVNLPLWFIGAFLLGGAFGIRKILRRLSQRRVREDHGTAP